MNEFLSVKRVLSEDDIAKFESDYGIVMPHDIKKHYLKYNGGYPEKSVFCTQEDGNIYMIDYFYSIGCNEGNAIEKILPLLRDKNVFPDWLVPLADEEGGNIFAYSTRKNEEGAIYYYSHEFEYGEDPEQHIKFLSKNIETFLEALEYEDNTIIDS